jgi:hypothetical protein
MKKTRLFMALGLALVLLMAALPAYADPNPGEGNTDVIVTNTNQNTGSAPAQVTAIYYNTGGASEYNRNQSINSRGSYNFRASDAQLGDNWNGSMVLQSDNELAAVAEVKYTGGTFHDDKETDAYTGYAVGASQMYFPFVAYASNQYTVITIQNTEDSATTVQMTYTNRDGNVDFANVSSTIPAFGSRSFPMNTPGQNGVPNLTQTPFYNQTGTWVGAVRVVAQNNKKIAAVASNHWNWWSVAYNGLSGGAQTNYVPSAERRDDPNQGWRGFSVIIVQCVSNSACNARLRFNNAGTGATNLTLTKTIAAGAAIGANTRTGGDFPANTFDTNLGDAWAGSVVVDTTNGTDVSVIAYSIRPGTNLAGATSAANAAVGGKETFLPAIYQRNTQNVSCPNNDNAWTQFSLIRIQNPTNSNATDVDLSYFNRDGSIAFQEMNQQIPANKSINRNTRVNCSTIPLGGNWSGSLYIRSNVDLVAVSETLVGSSDMSAYNGYSVNR